MIDPASLPPGWFVSAGKALSSREAEYARELPPVHPFAQVPVRVVAYRAGTDDILVQHVNSLETFSVVHLTWAGRREMPNRPTVEFTGTLADFQIWERTNWGD